MVEVVYEVRDDRTSEAIASFPAGTDGGSKAWLAEIGAINLSRGLNAADKDAGGMGWKYTVVRGYLIRDHRLPAFRNVVI